MNFAEAWALLLAGRRIRRASWDKGFFWTQMDGALFEHTDKPGADRWLEIFDVDAWDLMETDWEEA